MFQNIPSSSAPLIGGVTASSKTQKPHWRTMKFAQVTLATNDDGSGTGYNSAPIIAIGRRILVVIDSFQFS